METEGPASRGGDERNVNAAVAAIESLTDAEQAEVILRIVATKFARAQTESDGTLPAGTLVAVEVLVDAVFGLPCEDPKTRRAREQVVATAAEQALGGSTDEEAYETARLRRVARAIFLWSAERNPGIDVKNRAWALMRDLECDGDAARIVKLLDKSTTLESKTATIALALGVLPNSRDMDVRAVRERAKKALKNVVLR
jgi:hypothetical protein